ncbi:MAG TPA: TIGR03013 family XrtA/PEP-CTERM system glycosyltransferase [Candidatus Dormibacteraeota bacterium]|nr:TIGR03013 family XrtA/PEP-CTERM system glycosyltransferase [Candidatus Dormibacteraeota bacterium]
MVRLFHVYYPTRTLILLGGEVCLVPGSFLLATLLCFGTGQFYTVLSIDSGLYKILLITGLAILCLYFFDLYDVHRVLVPGEAYFRLFAGLGTLSLLLAGFDYLFPRFMLGRQVYVAGLVILTLYLVLWRALYMWLIGRRYLSERVYVLGAGTHARQLVQMIRSQSGLGLELVGWGGEATNPSPTRESLAESLETAGREGSVDRVIVALSDRRNLMPVRELLDLRLRGVKIEEATALQEEMTGKIEVDDLSPSWLIFSEGFHVRAGVLMAGRILSVVVSLFGLLLSLVLLPWIALAIKLSSPGPLLYRQKRVGRNGATFDCYKFRTMRADAEADTGPTWAGDDDPRITRVGRYLRKARLDEIPQLWNVLRGDMNFVGPRPERPEFVDWLCQEIPYYNLRHIVLPGITGWAQINYSYGASLEESKEKLCYDLYYVKNMSLTLDLMIMFRTFKTVLLGRGSR